jgi:hypothetical protein
MQIVVEILLTGLYNQELTNHQNLHESRICHSFLQYRFSNFRWITTSKVNAVKISRPLKRENLEIHSHNFRGGETE